MSDCFSNLNNPWGSQNPGQPCLPGQQYPGYPGFPAAGQQYPTGATICPTAPIVAPGPKAVPCALPLPSGCTQGMMLNICGIPTGNRFFIDFEEGNNVAFHFNPRFDENPKVVVRNSVIQGTWGQEERQCPKFPFQMQQPFKLQILFEPDDYKVIVNNETICKYSHKLKNFAGIKIIRIHGAVTINNASVTMV
ncbi:galectin-3-like [Ranitomeya imitator]|uniref:galectin-3-like n=1 Tax=Ranitomeya imitator TaxID=111125 RepID=UPI0037E95DC2